MIRVQPLPIFAVVVLSVPLLFSSVADAEVKVDSVARQYNDGKTKVLSPHLDVESPIMNGKGRIGMGFAADVLTSSSSDVKSFASASKEISENRKEFGANFGLNVSGGTLGLGYVQSDENDYHSKTYSLGATREFFEKNTVMGISFATGKDNIQSSADTSFDQFMTNQTYSFSVTQILGKINLIQFLYDFRVENGYLASPYRRARLLQSDGTVIGVPENHPRSRGRNSIAVKYNHQFVGLDLSLANSFRFYFDTWAVQSSTIEERLTKPFGKKFSLSLSYRYYQQRAANFYRDRYTSNPDGFVSGNKTLASYYSMLVGLRPTIFLTDKLQFFLKGEYYLQKFQDHTDVGNITDPTDDKALNIEAQIVGVGFIGIF